ncbi:MAG: M23 family metallopeptidase [Corynebacterium sp.]|uniref:M23 family metallopeptidase n=1 Tax=uncultured Corynebacterium sp. TaxID=159447 RepID=UPI0018383ACB|nr:M23 family metallopeptidase [uncultured Corynebacterium sp.]NLZ56941.1 M23 family metallopeptidase [Corynebacterium sp.]
MQEQTRRVGKHRKFHPSQAAKGRVAFVAVATGAVSTAGAGGAVAAQAQTQATAESAVDVDYKLTANEVDSAFVGGSSAPQILAIAEFKPVVNLGEQITKTIQYNAERIQADLDNRGPSVVKPAEGAFTSGFGPRWGTVHQGIDIANAVGTPILSVMDGVVIDSGPASGYGNWIRIQHTDGSVSVYGHMETLDVSVGQTVRAGEKIAGMGNRGFSTGSHLHFEIHPAGSGPVDPQPWLAERGITL